jgi:hypothetical protein
MHLPRPQSVGSLETRIAAAVKKIQDACANDVKAYCSNVTLGEGRLALCMMAHEEQEVVPVSGTEWRLG